MSRDSEKVLKELQKFLDAHAEDTENEADVDALAERFFAEYNLKCKEQKESAPETADDYLDLAEQVTSKKKKSGISAQGAGAGAGQSGCKTPIDSAYSGAAGRAAACLAGAARRSGQADGKVRRVQGVRR